MATASKIKPGTDENLINLDFRGVKPRGGGRAAKVPPGDYLLEVVSAKNVPIASGVNKGKRQIAWVTRIVAAASDDPEAQAGIGDAVYMNTQVEWSDPEKQGWFLRNLLEDLTGADVTGKALGLPLDKLPGKRFGATLNWGKEYEDKQGETQVRSEIKYTFPAAKFVGEASAPTQDEQEADEAPAPAPKAKSNGKAPAKAEEAAEAVTEADEDEDLEELSIQSL